MKSLRIFSTDSMELMVVIISIQLQDRIDQDIDLTNQLLFEVLVPKRKKKQLTNKQSEKKN